MVDNKVLMTTMLAIVGTGAFLNVAGSGMLGSLPQQTAKFITKGYGV